MTNPIERARGIIAKAVYEQNERPSHKLSWGRAVDTADAVLAALAEEKQRIVPREDLDYMLACGVDRSGKLRAALQDIRNKVHAHNRGGELSYGLRETVRGICDAALNSKEKE